MSSESDLPVTGWLGMGALWKGDLEYQGRVRIDGTLLGNVRTSDLLDVGAAGRIEGKIEVAQALVGGVVEGEIHASERLTILPTAVVRGLIRTPWLDVRTGAQIEGELHVIRDEPSGTS